MKSIASCRVIPARPRRATLSAGWPAAALAALVVLAACGGSPSSAGHGGISNAGRPVGSEAAISKAVAFSECMRSHGVPEFPDPASTGGIPKVSPQQAGVSNSRFLGAQQACGHLLEPSQAQQAQILTGMLGFARCMRSHGIPAWPDPSTDSAGHPAFNIPGINPNAAQVSNVADECTHLLVQSTTGPTTIQLCNGIGEQGGCHGYGDPSGG